MTATDQDPRGVVSPKVRLAVAVLIGVTVAALVATAGPLALATIAGLAALSFVFVVSGVLFLYRLGPDDTRAHATQEDLNHWLDDVLVLVVAVGAGLGIVVVALLGRSGTGDLAAAVALVGVFTGWAMLHTTYAARYARAWFDPVDGGGIDFNTTAAPRYSDFYYFSFNLGMTFQVSDTAVSSARVRRLVLGHCLLSYLFGTVILAATINLVAGVALGV